MWVRSISRRNPVFHQFFKSILTFNSHNILKFSLNLDTWLALWIVQHNYLNYISSATTSHRIFLVTLDLVKKFLVHWTQSITFYTQGHRLNFLQVLRSEINIYRSDWRLSLAKRRSAGAVIGNCHGNCKCDFRSGYLLRLLRFTIAGIQHLVEGLK